MLLTRRKILLTLLRSLGGTDKRLSGAHRDERIQLLLWLVSRAIEQTPGAKTKMSEPPYYFIPSPTGPYSFESRADKSALVFYERLRKIEEWELIGSRADGIDLPQETISTVESVSQEFGALSDEALLDKVLTLDPAMSMNMRDELRRAKRPVGRGTTLFTIGYEGRHVEQYVNELIAHDVKLLADVRRNAISMKYGFSKSQLRRAVETVGIEYVHMAHLGVPSDRRKEATTDKGRKKMFDDYVHDILPYQGGAMERLMDLVIAQKRVAITCFERDASDCHRSYLAKALSSMPDWKFSVKNI